jgi:hypothetical protein
MIAAWLNDFFVKEFSMVAANGLYTQNPFTPRPGHSRMREFKQLLLE